MLRYLKINIICILFLALSFPAASELYQYIDENGIMRITDTIYSVPVGQRAQLEQFDDFEDLSNEIKILPIPQIKHQAPVKKDITAKTAKEIPAETEKNIIRPDAEKTMVSETKDEATDPFQPIDPEQPIKEADTKASPTVQHISKKITIRKIDKKAPSQKPALIKEPEKNVKKKADPIKMPKTDPESKIVSNDQTQITTVKNPAPIPDSKTEPKKITPAENLADTEKTATASKTTQLKPEKAVQENAGPDAIKLDTTKSSTKKQGNKKETPPKTPRKVVQMPEKKAEIKSAQKTDKPTVEKEKTKPADTATDKKTTRSQKSNIEPNESIKQSDTHPELINRPIPESKPEIKIVKKEPAEKIIVQKPEPIPDSDNLSETKKTKPDTRQITSKESELIKTPEQTGHLESIVARSQKIDTGNSKVTQKDENIILAKLESTRKILSNKKEALNKKFMALMKEKQEIEDSVNEDDEKSVLQYNENVKKLNLKIKQYKTEKKFLQAEIEKYNHAIKQSALN